MFLSLHRTVVDADCDVTPRYPADLRGKCGMAVPDAGRHAAGTAQRSRPGRTAPAGRGLLGETGAQRGVRFRGLAWRVMDAGGPGTPLDIALSTTGRAEFLRHLLVPRRDFAKATFTSLLPYRIGGRNRYVAAVPDTHPSIPADTASLAGRVHARRFVLTVMVADLTGPWRPVAGLRIDRASDEDPAFDVVVNALPGFAPAGWINWLRGPAYRGSQRGSRRRH